MNSTPAVRETLNWEMLSKSTGAWIGLIVAILVLAYIVSRIRALYREDDDPAGGLQQMLNDADEMLRRGELSQTEYRSIQSRLSRQIVGVSAKAEQATRSDEPVQTDGSAKDAPGRTRPG
jgi:hypothetical protein